MNTLTNYIVFHNQESYDYFQVNNRGIDKSSFRYIQVGKEPPINDKVIPAYEFDDNIEEFPSLLSFTAWYLLAKNIVSFSGISHIGIFEYDVKFFKGFESIELNPNTITGFMKRDLPDKNGLYLDAIQGFKMLLTNHEIDLAERQPYWNATSNFIMPDQFLVDFVNWYTDKSKEILTHQKHSHYHERAVNVFAAVHGFKNNYAEILTHDQLCSHGINI